MDKKNLTEKQTENAIDSEIESSRSLKGFWRGLVIFITIGFILFTINHIFDFRFFANIIIFNHTETNIFVMLILPLAFLFYPIVKSNNISSKNRAFKADKIIFILLFLIGIFLSWNSFDMISRGWGYVASIYATIIAIIVWVLIIEAIRRTMGKPLAIVVTVVSTYPLIADKMPGFLLGNAFVFERLARYHIFTTDSAFGALTTVFNNIIIAFTIFSVIAIKTGAGEFILNLALSIFGKTRGGTAKVAVAASALFGTINGQPIVNVITTGTITIPAMKKAGYDSDYAGAVEAVSSTGGTFTPPVMGATAFVMAGFLGMPYSDIAIAAAIPAFLYYFMVYMQIDYYAVKNNIIGLSKEELPDFFQTMRQGWFYLISMVVLIYYIFFLKQVAEGAIISSFFMFLINQVNKSKRLSCAHILQMIEEIGKNCSMLLSVMLGVGMMIGTFSVTGLAVSFAREAMIAAGGNLYLLLVVCAFASFIMGMGMSTIACYIFLAIIIAPVLVMLGLNELAVHLFVLYCGMLSYITLPVALAVYPAAVIAKTSPTKVGYKAMQLGFGLFLLPFIFVLDSHLVLQGGNFGGYFYSFIRTLIGIFILSSAFAGHMMGLGFLYFKGVMGHIAQVALIVSGILIALPGQSSNIIGLVLILIILLFQRIRTKNVRRKIY